jgi:hypothetical protein
MLIGNKTLFGVVSVEIKLCLKHVEDLSVDRYFVLAYDKTHTGKSFFGFRRYKIVPLVISDVLNFKSVVGVSVHDILHQICGIFGDKARNLEVAFENLLVQIGCVWILKWKVTTD